MDSPSNSKFDPDEDRIFVQRLKGRLKPGVEVLEVDAKMEDPEFAKAVVQVALDAL